MKPSLGELYRLEIPVEHKKPDMEDLIRRGVSAIPGYILGADGIYYGIGKNNVLYFALGAALVVADILFTATIVNDIARYDGNFLRDFGQRAKPTLYRISNAMPLF